MVAFLTGRALNSPQRKKGTLSYFSVIMSMQCSTAAISLTNFDFAYSGEFKGVEYTEMRKISVDVQKRRLDTFMVITFSICLDNHFCAHRSYDSRVDSGMPRNFKWSFLWTISERSTSSFKKFTSSASIFYSLSFPCFGLLANNTVNDLFISPHCP